MELKLLNLTQTDVKLSGESRIFSGYASVFGGVDSYGDTIAPGAYKKTLKGRDRAVKMRWNHFGPVIGKWTKMEEDDKGLYVEGELTPGHSVADDVMASLKHGAVDGLSIGFYVKKADETESGRLLKEIELIEISVVEEPADNAARIADVKSAIQDAQTLKEIEAVLRDAGRFSKADATALVSRVKSLSLGDQVGKKETSDLVALIRGRANLTI
jgi:uncharacterized protein